jgi:ferrous iron transport protein B
MLGSVFFGRWAGTAVFAMYVTSIVLVVVVGLALRTTLWRTVGAEPLVLDLPPYQVPTLRLTLTVAWARLKGFLQSAAGIIVATVTLVWLAQAIPVGGGTFGAVPVADSLYAWVARAVTPVFTPTGFAQTAGAGGGFVAKEAVLSSWAQTCAADSDAARSEHLAWRSRPRPAAHLCHHGLLRVLLAHPCVRRWRRSAANRPARTAFQLRPQLVIAYGLAVAVFQLARLLG